MILQHSIPYDPRNPAPLPGIAPLPIDDWLILDEAYSAQLAEKKRFMTQQPDLVLALEPDARAAADELVSVVIDHLTRLHGAKLLADQLVRPDGETVVIDRENPMKTLGQLVQEDLCILQKRGDEHVLSAAVLCFPASWTLAEKFRKPLLEIHRPVGSYDANIAARVQRLFDGIQTNRPLWRFNALWYADADLYQPRLETAQRRPEVPGEALFLRSERQSMVRLPKTRAVVFSIHTFVLPRAAVAAQYGDLTGAAIHRV